MGVTVRSTNNIPRLKEVLKKLGKTSINVGVFGSDDSDLVKIARANEFGVTIKPKNKKWLALPTPLAKGKRPKDFTDLTFIMVHDHKKALLVRNTAGKGKKGARSEIYFILLKSVKIPERSFLRSGFDNNVNAITAKAKKHLNDVLDFGINPATYADMLGLEFAGMIQTDMRNLNSPPNAPLTIANKKSSNPLVDTGRLVGAIRHEVE